MQKEKKNEKPELQIKRIQSTSKKKERMRRTENNYEVDRREVEYKMKRRG